MTNISVVIPTRGGTGVLRACLDAILAQTPAPLEVIVVDNSPDGAAAAEIAGLEDRVCLAFEPVPGVSHARNRGISLARGKFLAFVDDDIRVAPGWLAALEDALAKPGVLAAGGPVRPLWESPPPRWLVDSRRAMGTFGLLDLGTQARVLDAERDHLVGGNLACRRDAVTDGRGFRAVWPCPGLGAVADDYELSRRLAREGRAVYEPRAAARHVVPRAKMKLARILRRVYASEAARASLGGRLAPRRGPRQLLGIEGLLSAAFHLGHLRARLRP